MASSGPGEQRFAFSTHVFVRLLAVVHAIAFGSAATQVAGLVGPQGIAPAGAYFAAAREQLGAAAYAQLPSLCWLFGTGSFLTALCALGLVLAALLFAGVAPAACLAGLWACYLSLCTAGQMFFAFQWDGLLLETTLLAIWVVPWAGRPGWRIEEPPRWGRWLLWWLLFRLMFLAGVVKLTSGDPTWRNLTALTFHFETQPLPTPLAWYAHQLPAWWQRAECAAMFVIELGLPFLLFGPRRVRHAAALTLAALMLAIAATGNYTFFNALAVILCLACLDDAAWARVLRLPRHPAAEAAVAADPAAGVRDASGPASAAPYRLSSRRPAGHREQLTAAFGVAAFAYTGVITLLTVAPQLGPPPGFVAAARVLEPLRSFNAYGLFAVMTHPRDELIIEGSDDDRTWREYVFPAKPGPVANRPTFVAPLQPRLDWQLWFAALGTPADNPWVSALGEQLLRGSTPVLALLAGNPFPHRPPKLLRIVRYEYHFTTRAERARTGNWWTRTPVAIYFGPVALRNDAPSRGDESAPTGR